MLDLKYIDKVGLELEGGWTKAFSYTQFKNDVSVFRDGPPKGFPKTGHYGEVASDPLPPHLCEEWLAVHYPDMSDATCGFHIHTSFKKKRYYTECATREFYDFWVDTYEKWGVQEKIADKEFWSRLKGENRFCRKTFAAPAQMVLAQKLDVRRTHLNYCWTMHKTIENRMLPVFEKRDDAVSAMLMHFSIIENYLAGAMKKRATSHRMIFRAEE